MSKKSYLIIALLTLTVIIAGGIILSCSDDIVLEPLPSLLGEYEGRYLVTENVGTTSQKTSEYLIQWRFTDQNYFLKEADPNEICTPSGSYTLTSEVDLVEADNANGCYGVVGKEEFNPRGIFSLRQPSDSVILTQQTETMRKEIRLRRLSE